MPGHVAQRRVLATALVERPQRLALEVDDRPVRAVADRQRLAEVEVAVVTELHDAHAARRAPAASIAGGDAVRQPSSPSAARAASSWRCTLAVHAVTSAGGDRLGRELGRAAPAARERQVQRAR